MYYYRLVTTTKKFQKSFFFLSIPTSLLVVRPLKKNNFFAATQRYTSLNVTLNQVMMPNLVLLACFCNFDWVDDKIDVGTYEIF